MELLFLCFSLCMRERVVVVTLLFCRSVVQHGISKTANFYPFKRILS